MKTKNLTTFKSGGTKILAELLQPKEPALITEHDLACAPLVDVANYEVMVSRIKILDGIVLGEKAIKENLAVTHSQAKLRLNKWLQ